MVTCIIIFIILIGLFFTIGAFLAIWVKTPNTSGYLTSTNHPTIIPVSTPTETPGYTVVVPKNSPTYATLTGRVTINGESPQGVIRNGLLGPDYDSNCIGYVEAKGPSDLWVINDFMGPIYPDSTYIIKHIPINRDVTNFIVTIFTTSDMRDDRTINIPADGSQINLLITQDTTYNLRIIEK